MQTRSVFMEQLNGLRQEIRAMAAKVEEDLGMAITALRNDDTELAQKVVDNDAALNAMQIKIDDETAVTIATQHPVARDLREMVAILRITDNLERIGDYAVHLAKTAIKFSGKPSLEPAVRLEKMAETGREMIRDVISAYIGQDAQAARKTAQKDEIIDKEHKDLTREVLVLMKENSKLVKQAARLLNTSNQLERLGDHIKNTCESVIYMVEGKRV